MSAQGTVVRPPSGPAQPKGVVVFSGGFDSYLEELFPFFFWWRDAGYDVVAFEGPGQGVALQAMHVTCTPAPAAHLQAIQRYTAAEISSRVTQDVLLLAGNFGLALQVITAWLDSQAAKAQPV